MRIFGIVALGAAAVFSVLTTQAAKANCSDATDTYNSAISDVSDALKRYTRCLSSSNGHDDCSSEFRKLKNAQSGFESAVSDMKVNAMRVTNGTTRSEAIRRLVELGLKAKGQGLK